MKTASNYAYTTVVYKVQMDSDGHETRIAIGRADFDAKGRIISAIRPLR